MIKSMTGFGAGRATSEVADIAVEIKTVNARFLKLNIKAPSSFGAREPAIETKLKAAMQRGSVSATIRWRSMDPSQVVSINEEVVRAYQSEFRRLKMLENSLPQMPGVLGSAVDATASDTDWARLEPVLAEALAELIAMREAEGAALEKVLLDLTSRIADCTEQVAERSPVVVVESQAKLQARIAKLLPEGLPLDEQQLAREVAFIADRSDITEEVDRLRAHVEHFRAKLRTDEPVGRALEFIAQEMLREVNTIGSKSADPQLSKLVVAMKSEVERIKEQVANVE